jgi:hypothetical protein
MDSDPPEPIYRKEDQLPRAIRLTFSYVGSRIELISAQQLTKLVPPSDPIQQAFERSGFRFELRGRDEEPLYRQVIGYPIQIDHEVFPEDPTGEIIREPVKDPKGVFSIVIPEISEARTVSLVGSSLENFRVYGEPDREVGRFSMSEVMRLATRAINE